MTPAILSDETAFLAELSAAGCSIKGRSCSCPWHDDRTPSCQFSQGADGTWRLYCHVCARHGNTIDLIAHRTRRDPGDVFGEMAKDDSRKVLGKPQERKSAREPKNDYLKLPSKREVAQYCEREGKVEAWHVYGPKDAPVLIVARIRKPDGKKTFRQFTPIDGGYAAKNLHQEGTLPLYRQDELTGSCALIVEGEKCADACWRAGVQAVTSAMGAGKAGMSSWAALAGKSCYLWPDNDETGLAHMRAIASILEGIGASCYWIDPKEVGLPPKGDVADLCASLSPESANITITEIMREATPMGAAKELSDHINDIIAGKYVSLGTASCPVLCYLTKALLPGSVVSLCADPGAGKSLWLLQILADLHRDGIKVAAWELEDKRSAHLLRALAQADGQAVLVDDRAIREYPDVSKMAMMRHESFLSAFGACIRAEEDEQPKLADIAEWIEAKAKAGARVIAVDPVTAAATEREPWAADTAFLMRVKKIARDNGATIILVTHPKGMNKGASLGGMAGGSAYPRFSHVALWMEKMEMQQALTITNNLIGINRIMRITKSRYGRGGGMDVGLCFDSDTLRFVEMGPLMPEAKKTRRQAAPVHQPDKESAEARAKKLSKAPGGNEDLFQ
jgi:archaellum biogenesis ATPase FlaH